MTDLNALVAAIAASGDRDLRLRQGVIVTVNANGTANVTIAGSTQTINNVAVASHVCPRPNTTCWLITDGRDWFVLATLANAGPAWGAMRQSVAQAIPTGAFTAMAWANRTDTASNGVTLSNTGLVCVVPGLYQITAAGAFAANAVGQRHMVLTVNGGNAIHGTGGDAAAGADIQRLRADGLWRLAVGDVVNFDLFQSSGANLNTQIGAGYCLLRMVWIGPTA